MINKIIVLIEWVFIVLFHYFIIVPDWNKSPVVKDYFALLIIGELMFESYSRLKKKL